MDKNLIKKILIIVIIISLIAAFFLLDLNQYLTLSYLKQSKDKFENLYTEQTVLVIAVYMIIYIVTTALSLPGATVLTIAGGAMFGLMTGVIIVSFASTIGATLACFVSRYLLRDWIQNKFGDRLSIINEGIENEGSFYLFTMRLIPMIPFFMINLLMGLTRMPLLTFFWVSQVGMLAGTIVYVNAGNELGKIESLSGILSPTLILSFVLIGIFPILTKKLLDYYKSKK